MPSYLSSASAPSPAAPQPIPPGPEIVRPAARRPRRTGAWALLLLGIAAGAGILLKTRTTAPAGKKAEAAVTRTAAIAIGDVSKTIRVTGTIQAERFAAILAPQIRGSRGDRGRTFSGGGGGGGSSSASSSSTSSGSTSSTSSSSSASTGTSASDAGSSTSTSASSTTTTSSLGAIRGTTNRFSDMSGSSTKGGAGGTGATSSSSLTGSTNLGSTSGALISPSGGGGGGGMSDFSMVLLKCAPAGSHVKKGDTVAEFDRQYQLLRLDDYKASVAQHEANILKLKADQAVAREAHDQQVFSAKADWEKAKLDLQTITVRSEIEAESYKLSEQEAAAHYKQILAEAPDFEESQRAALHGSELDRDQAKIELQRAQNNVNRMIMKAPIDGIVVMQTIFRGGDFGQVQQGDQVYSGMVFMTIVDPSSMVLNATVNQADSEQFRPGMKATVRFDAYPDVRLPATVAAVGAITNSGGWRANWVREVPLRLKLDAADPRVIPDLTGSAEVEVASEKQAAVAPLESIFRDGADRQPYALVQTPSGFEKRSVELGLASNTKAAVRSGLRAGEVVALMRPVQEKK